MWNIIKFSARRLALCQFLTPTSLFFYPPVLPLFNPSINSHITNFYKVSFPFNHSFTCSFIHPCIHSFDQISQRTNNSFERSSYLDLFPLNSNITAYFFLGFHSFKSRENPETKNLIHNSEKHEINFVTNNTICEQCLIPGTYQNDENPKAKSFCQQT